MRVPRGPFQRINRASKPRFPRMFIEAFSQLRLSGKLQLGIVRQTRGGKIQESFRFRWQHVRIFYQKSCPQKIKNERLSDRGISKLENFPALIPHSGCITLVAAFNPSQ